MVFVFGVIYSPLFTKIKVIDTEMEIMTFLHRFDQHFKMSEYFTSCLEKPGVLINADRSNLSRCVAGLNSGPQSNHPPLGAVTSL